MDQMGNFDVLTQLLRYGVGGYVGTLCIWRLRDGGLRDTIANVNHTSHSPPAYAIAIAQQIIAEFENHIKLLF